MLMNVQVILVFMELVLMLSIPSPAIAMMVMTELLVVTVSIEMLFPTTSSLLNSKKLDHMLLIWV